MREDVLSLHAMGGDPVSEEYLKAELYHRAEALKDIPDTPLFFGRLDYAGQAATGQSATGQAGSGNYGSGISDDGVWWSRSSARARRRSTGSNRPR